MTDSITRYRRAIREADMERTIREGVEANGGCVWSVRDSRGLPIVGMPDLIIVAPAVKTVAFLELKSQRRDVTAEQAHVLGLLAACDGVVSGVVRPIPRDGELSFDEALARLGVVTP